MAKSRKTKAKHQDFQKVKIKVGRKLPRGLNETKTAFKSKAIQIKEQIKQDKKEPTTKRKLTISELLSQCQHYNISMRHDAVTGLRELVTAHPDFIHSHLSFLLERVAPLYLDKDGAVRQAVHRFLKVMLAEVPLHQIQPFFPVLSAHLRCAMTHIQDDIQLDSLQLLDLFLKYYPQLVIADQSRLLQSFIDQISRKSQGSNTSARSLIVNPSSRITGQKWRMKVLERLHSFMKAINETSMSKPAHASVPANLKLSWSSGSSEILPLTSYTNKWAFGVITLKRTEDNSKPEDSVTDVGHGRSFVEMLMPLLMQCWVEVGPAQLATNLPGNAMSAEALATLFNILSITQLVMKNLAESSQSNRDTWMKEKFLKDFEQYFMSYFPYAMHERVLKGKNKGKSKSEIPEVSIVLLNLFVCEIMSHFVHWQNLRNLGWFHKVKDFLVHTLEKGRLTQDQLSLSLSTIATLLKCKLDQETQEELFGSVFQLYISKNCQAADKVMLLNFFSDTVLKHYDSASFKSVRSWMCHLPAQLVALNGQVTALTLKLLKVMKVLASQGHPAFLEALQEDSVNILELVPCGSTELQNSFSEMFLLLPKWKREHFVIIAELCRSGRISCDSFKYLLHILVYRMSASTTGINLVDFFSCIASCLLGESAETLEELQKKGKTVGSFCTKFDIVNSGVPCSQLKFTRVICDTLLAFEEDETVRTITSHILEKTLNENRCLPLGSVCSVLHTATLLFHNQDLGHNLLNLLVDLSIAMLHFLEESDGDTAQVTLPTLLLAKEVCTHFLEGQRDACEKLLLLEVSHWHSAQHQQLSQQTKIIAELLRNREISLKVPHIKDQLNAAVQATQEKNEDIIQYQWWSDLKYAISLLR